MSKINWGKQLKRLERNVNKLAERRVEVGFFPESGYHKEADMPLANLMAIHELRDDAGQRPLFKIMTLKYSNKGRLKSEFIQIASNFVANSVKKGGSTQKFCNDLGKMIKEDIGNQFGKTISEGGLTVHPNKPSTISLKGFDAPLVETGKLKAGLLYKVKKKGV